MKRFWAVSLHSSFFAEGVAWATHAKRHKLIPLVADTGLGDDQIKQLVAAEVTVLPAGPRTHFDVWHSILQADLDVGVLLYTSPADLFDPAETIKNGTDHMVFTKWPSDTEYYNLCSPMGSVVSRAKLANLIESRVAEKQNGIAAPTRVCGPFYLWCAMMGTTRLIRAGQQHQSQRWEPVAANMFAASYPEYTLLES